MRLLKYTLTTSILCIIILMSCGKITKESRFTWTYKGTTYVAIQKFARTGSMGGPSIGGSLQSGIFAGPDVRLILLSFQPGSYPVATGSSNLLYFIDEAGFVHTGVSGNINITSNKESRLSGNFNILLTNNEPLTGSFSNIVIEP